MKVKFKQDYSAKGVNYIYQGGAYSSQQAVFQLKYDFKKGDIFEMEQIPTQNLPTLPKVNCILPGEPVAQTVIVPAGSKTMDGKKFNGIGKFGVPNQFIEQISSVTDNGKPFKLFSTDKILIGVALLIAALLLIPTTKN